MLDIGYRTNPEPPIGRHPSYMKSYCICCEQYGETKLFDEDTMENCLVIDIEDDVMLYEDICDECARFGFTDQDDDDDREYTVNLIGNLQRRSIWVQLNFGFMQPWL